MITHPVDSATRLCCGAIGRHTPTCTALLLDRGVNLLELARADLDAALQGLPGDAPLFAVVDLVAALGHLRKAATRADRCADALEKTESADLARAGL